MHSHSDYILSIKTIRYPCIIGLGEGADEKAQEKLLEWASSDRHPHGKLKFITFEKSECYWHPPVMVGVWEIINADNT